jgi:two-component system, OmpR family, phosphate regulon sensor histidine kinase PhoR
MKRRGIFAWIYPPFIAAFIISAAAFTAFTAESATKFFSDLSSLELARTARLSMNALAPLLSSQAPDGRAVQAACDALASGSGLRLTVIAPDGYVIADTQAASEGMDIHLNREEIREALTSGSGSAVRKSATTGIATFYEAIVLKGAFGKPLAVVRASMPFSIIGSRRMRLLSSVLLFGFCLTLLASLIAYFVARRLASPIKRIHSGALAFSAGRLADRIPEEGPREAVELARVLNRMAADLDEKLNTIREQKDQAEAVLNGMSEAVAVVDAELRLVKSNPAFDRLFGKIPPTDPAEAKPSLLSVTRNAELCDFMEAAAKAKGPLETNFGLYGDEPRQLRAVSSPLAEGSVVLVLNDLTRLSRLERVRRDFTANVSHELKTPITAIRAALETLSDEGLADPQANKKFLGMAIRGTDRLEAILGDLLSLARVEEEEKKGIELTRVELDRVVESALAGLRERAGAAGMRIETEGERALAVPGNEGLLVQALSNLIDNAIKYASSGGILKLKISSEGGKALISVADSGPGIPERDKPRLFERFYRVDKARSRDSGGTGLGLSIVKHIALAHSGSVRVESAEGSGSTFTILLPIA